MASRPVAPPKNPNRRRRLAFFPTPVLTDPEPGKRIFVAEDWNLIRLVGGKLCGAGLAKARSSPVTQGAIAVQHAGRSAAAS